MAGYTAVLDACVLVPIALADTLLRVAERGLYRPLWSERILQETTDAVLEIHPDVTSEDVKRRIDAMNRFFEDALVEGWEDIESSFALPDPDDRHVVAAAIPGRADTIVTANLGDYPEDLLEPLDSESQ